MNVFAWGGVQLASGYLCNIYAQFAGGKGMVSIRSKDAWALFYPTHAGVIEGGALLSDDKGNSCLLLSDGHVGWGFGAFGSAPLPLVSGQVQVTTVPAA